MALIPCGWKDWLALHLLGAFGLFRVPMAIAVPGRTCPPGSRVCAHLTNIHPILLAVDLERVDKFAALACSYTEDFPLLLGLNVCPPVLIRSVTMFKE
jgi:hypothetical protein